MCSRRKCSIRHFTRSISQKSVHATKLNVAQLFPPQRRNNSSVARNTDKQLMRKDKPATQRKRELNIITPVDWSITLPRRNPAASSQKRRRRRVSFKLMNTEIMANVPPALVDVRPLVDDPPALADDPPLTDAPLALADDPPPLDSPPALAEDVPNRSYQSVP